MSHRRWQPRTDVLDIHYGEAVLETRGRGISDLPFFDLVPVPQHRVQVLEVFDVVPPSGHLLDQRAVVRLAVVARVLVDRRQDAPGVGGRRDDRVLVAILVVLTDQRWR